MVGRQNAYSYLWWAAVLQTLRTTAHHSRQKEQHESRGAKTAHKMSVKLAPTIKNSIQTAFESHLGLQPGKLTNHQWKAYHSLRTPVLYSMKK